MLLIIHGGAGNKRPTKKSLKILSESLSSGYEILLHGGPALDAVVAAIAILEDSGMFNAGPGGVLQLDGVQRLDASIMEGKELKAGAVIGLEGIRNPIKAARTVMDSPHVMLTDLGASKMAKDLEPLPEPDKKSRERLARTKKKEKKIMEIYREHFSTVGAVALDMHGNLAAGTSTGGSSAMLPGRVGDTPIIGAGTYAENSLGAVSCTGKGESIIRLSLAKEICMNMRTLPPLKAAVMPLKRILRIDGAAGAVVINGKEKFAIMHTTNYMASGYATRKRVVVKEGFTIVER